MVLALVKSDNLCLLVVLGWDVAPSTLLLHPISSHSEASAKAILLLNVKCVYWMGRFAAFLAALYKTQALTRADSIMNQNIGCQNLRALTSNATYYTVDQTNQLPHVHIVVFHCGGGASYFFLDFFSISCEPMHD